MKKAVRWEEAPEEDDSFGAGNSNPFDVQRTRTSTIAATAKKVLVPDEIKLEIPANETADEKKEREKAERKARME